jgi:cyclophilin family peptidyl-prolyl cis-trans isomerase
MDELASALRAILVCIAVAGVGLLSAAARAAPDPEPVPDRAALSSALSAFKKEFRAELKADEPDAQRELANALLKRAAVEADAARRYVYIEQAGVAAEGARDIALALRAADALDAAFAIDRPASVLKSVGRIAKGSKDVGLLAEAASACVDVAGAAMTGSDASTAGAAMSAAKSLAKKAKMDGIGARAGALAKLVPSFKRMTTGVKDIETALADPETQAAAHTTMGRFECFGRGDWDAGLPHLAQSGDAALRQLAEAELALADAPEGRLDVANGWWDAAQSERDALAKARMLAHAAGLYETLLRDDPPESADEIRGRLETLTYFAWNGGVALTTDFSKYGPANAVLATLRTFIAKQKIDKDRDDWRTKLPIFPDVSFTKGQEFFWRLETNHGEIVIRFFPDTAPRHVANFLYLTELGFFDGLTFHRVIPGFMAQGGDPTGSGSGGPGYFIEGEYEGEPKHDEAGTLSMANTGEPKSDGSQFFITFRACPELDGKHTVFGEVTDGMKVVKKLEDEGTAGGTPKSELIIERATVFMR